jgi:hypothetical protein
MNQDQLKALLLRLEEPEEDFSLIFSGKKSKKVDGLYYPDTAEIIIHNRNMERDDELVYTAVHEYAHHLNAVRRGKTGRSHSREFWAVFHRLLERAEEQGIYTNPLRTDAELHKIAERLRKEYLQEEGERMLAFGRLLMEAMQICRDKRYSFDDFVDRELGLHRTIAKTLIRSYREDVPSDLGYENMKSLLRIKDPALRSEAAQELRDGKSPDMVYQSFSGRSEPHEKNELEELEKEKRRIERSLQRLSRRLEEIEEHLLRFPSG